MPKNVVAVLQWYSVAHHRGLARYAKEAGWGLDASRTRYEHAIEFGVVDGIICHLSSDNSATAAVLNCGLPVVDLSNTIPDPRLARVLQDNIGIGRTAAEHFMERGFERFVFCAPRHDAWPAAERFKGFQTALHERNFDCLGLFPSERPADTGSSAKWVGKRLRELVHPTAVLTFNDDFAGHILRACAYAGLRVPGDVAIVGCDNDELTCEFSSVPLSSVDTNLESHAYAGAALLDRLMKGGKAPHKPLRVPCGKVVVRQSSDMLAIEHPKLADAVRKIRDNFCDRMLSVASVADAVGMSRRWLDSECHRRLGRTLSEELRKMRIEKAMSLMRETDWKIVRIASECGYSRTKHLRDTLLRETGLTPRKYRESGRVRGET